MTRSYKKNFGILIIVIILVVSLIGPYLPYHDPFSINLEEGLSPPSSSHLLGQDKLGRDVLSRLIHGARLSLEVGIITVSISLLIGLLLGSVVSFTRPLIGEFIMRLSDIVQAFPGILLAIALASILGPSKNNVILSLSLLGWVGYFRLTRAELLKWKNSTLVMAERCIGASTMRILAIHLLPKIIPILSIQALFGMASAVMAEGALSFLGIGVSLPHPSLGNMIAEARPFIAIAPYLTLFPGFTIMLLILGLHLLGDAMLHPDKEC